ncbi:MAG: hypothetical protein IJ217_02440 [Clostridia bacterium]|nr:hypothetical protein [Clostridia bacterium]
MFGHDELKAKVFYNETGFHAVYKFPNGYGASVIRGPYSYGGKFGLYELAILKDGDICYDHNEVTGLDGVVGFQTEEQIGELLERIRLLSDSDDATN